MSDGKAVSVFCGASPGNSERYHAVAGALGRGLAEAGIATVYGGGNVGLMGAVADAALAAGGNVIGVIPTFLEARELARKELTALHVVDSMHERKRLMFDLSHAACALPGGLGTLDELIEFVTWRQLGLHARPMVIVNTDGYWDPLRALVDHVIANGFAAEAARTLFTFVPSPEDAVAHLAGVEIPAIREADERL